MQVKEIMSREVESVGLDTTLVKVAEMMKTHDIGMLPVRNGDALVGLITDRDITLRATANGLPPEKTRSRDIMTTQVIHCFEDEDIEQAGKMMQENKIRRLPVINRERRLVGVISMGDIALATDKSNLVYAAVQNISTPDAPKPLPGQKRE